MTLLDLQSTAGLCFSNTIKYQIPRTHIKFDERCFSFTISGLSAWNSLPSHVLEITNISVFKRQLNFRNLYLYY